MTMMSQPSVDVMVDVRLVVLGLRGHSRTADLDAELGLARSMPAQRVLVEALVVDPADVGDHQAL